MTRYCLENQSEESIIHRVDCSSCDLATLLGSGGIVDIGEWQSSLQALHEVRHSRPDVVRCVDCCSAELLIPRLQMQPALMQRITE